MNDPTTTTYLVTDRSIHVERLDDETLIYDQTTDHVVRLAREATLVWDACAPGATMAAIGSATGLSPGVIQRVLADLAEAGLIQGVGPGITRRSFGAKVAVGALATSGIALVSITAAPTAASAQSGPGGGGGSSGGGCDTPECSGG
ncbi:MAG: MarR family transcriptional regulator [Aquihabitans sp.]